MVEVNIDMRGKKWSLQTSPPPLIITDADISVNQTFPNNYNITDADIFVM